MTRRADNDNSPRLLSRKQAAAYLGIGETTFSLWVSAHKIPSSVAGTRRWDKKAIDARLDELSGLSVNDNEDPYEKWMRENAS
jgi:predicted DNA-binding transcriptional regulator AlpA